MKNTLIGLAVVVIIGAGAWAFTSQKDTVSTPTTNNPQQTTPVVQDTAQASVGLNKPFSFNGTAVAVKAVKQDSRCPADVQCIWAGTVVLTLSIVSPNNVSSTSEIELGKTITLQGMSLTLNSVSPVAMKPGKIEDDAYLFAFTFKKL